MIGNINNLSPIKSIIVDSLNPNALNNKAVKETKTSSFDEALKAALNVFNETNTMQKTADIAQQDFITGKNDNMITVLMAEQKALTSLDLTVQLTSKIVESYREIMRMQL